MNKTIAILSHGKSLYELENRIQEFKDYDITWMSLNAFFIIEYNILSKINKKLNIVLDCSTVADSYLRPFENNIRLPRLEKFLKRNDNNIWLTTFGVVDLYRRKIGKSYFIEKYKPKIFIIDDLFPKQRITYFMDVSNSVTFLIAYAMYCRAQCIILFGFDGYKGNYENNLDSYYKPELQAKERIVAVGNPINSDIKQDTVKFEYKFPQLYREYCNLFKVNTQIINCSPNSEYTILQKESYDNIHKYING